MSVNATFLLSCICTCCGLMNKLLRDFPGTCVLYIKMADMTDSQKWSQTVLIDTWWLAAVQVMAPNVQDGSACIWDNLAFWLLGGSGDVLFIFKYNLWSYTALHRVICQIFWIWIWGQCIMFFFTVSVTLQDRKKSTFLLIAWRMDLDEIFGGLMCMSV